MIVLMLAVVGFNSCLSEKAPAPTEAIANPIDSAQYTYTLRIKTIFDVNCNQSGCHDAATAQSGVILADYATARNSTRIKSVICSMEHGTGCKPMPDGLPQLPDTTINAVRVWVAKGYPE